jgi:hypothetical protein
VIVPAQGCQKSNLFGFLAAFVALPGISGKSRLPRFKGGGNVARKPEFHIQGDLAAFVPERG